MELKELKSKLRTVTEKTGFYMMCSDKPLIQPLISTCALRTYTKDNIWMYVWRNNRIGSKQRIKEYISCLIMKENNRT